MYSRYSDTEGAWMPACLVSNSHYLQPFVPSPREEERAPLVEENRFHRLLRNSGYLTTRIWT